MGHTEVLMFPHAHYGLRRQKRDWVIPPIPIRENEKGPFPKMVAQVKSDKGKKIQVFYSITGMGADKPPCGVFIMDRETGWLKVTMPLDREQESHYVASVSYMALFFHAASSTGNAVEEPTETVITVVGPNDNTPEFTRVVFEASVMERAHPGTSVMQITATDADDHENTYNAAIDPSAKTSAKTPRCLTPTCSPSTRTQESSLCSLLGWTNRSGVKRGYRVVQLNVHLSQLIASVYTLTIQAADLQGEGLSSTGTAVTTVTHSNANPPGFSPTLYTGQVFENKVDAGILRLKVKREDAPGSPAGKAVFSILNDRAGLYTVTTDPETNNGLLKTAKGLDFETTQQYVLYVTVVDAVPLASLFTSTATVTVDVLDVNEAPVFVPLIQMVEMPKDISVGQEITSYRAQDPDSFRSQEIRYQIGHDPSHQLNINSGTGVISTRASLHEDSVENHTFSAVVIAVDNGQPPAMGTRTLLLTFSHTDCPVADSQCLSICRRGREPEAVSMGHQGLSPNVSMQPCHQDRQGTVHNQSDRALT
ncbi:cadherin-1-like [Lynx pardinus]|uniref:Cadherin-1-like n=1 Tax=Lynx pardinus TaxID=191816 RepID=A0A485NR76_LYNPA|nr:cadherin-1-like [Lynx pardinus]